MTHNDVLRSLRYLLDISDAELQKIAQLAGYPIDESDISAYLQHEEDEGYQPCPDLTLAHVLNGLVIFKRGQRPDAPVAEVETPVTNNQVLKKLRVAFELKDEDIHAMLVSVGLPMGKAELSALFRKPGHKNYRPCGDQVLRNFLKGLTQRQRG